MTRPCSHGPGGEPPTELRELRAGPVTAKLEGVDLRYVSVGPTELVRRLYVAVRDESWGTVPAEISNLELTDRGDSFSLAFDARNRSDGLDFGWHGTIVGESDGTITARMKGVAGSAFSYNRIGFCVLHPLRENAGRPYRAETPGGPISGTLPDLIAPQALEGGVLFPVFPSYSSLSVDLAEGAELRFEFEGDLFEMEDQRNWIDGSLKTYSTPLSLGFPHEAQTDQGIVQAVVVSASGLAAPSAALSSGTVLSVEEQASRPLPLLGLGVASDGQPLGQAEIEQLRCLSLDHLRVDAQFSDDAWAGRVSQAIEEAGSLGCELELAVMVRADHAGELDSLAGLLADAHVARVLVFGDGAATNTAQEASPPELVAFVRERLESAVGGAPFVGGTDMDFCNLNRTRRVSEVMDGVYWSMNPQVHAFDDRSLMETCEPQGDTVRTARSFCGDLPLIVSAVTLLPRWNPYVVGPIPEPGRGELPPEVDPRQASQLAAAWTLGSLKYLAEAGAASITYYETVGWRGLLERETGSPEPELFPSEPGQPFPLYRVFAELAKLKDAEVVVCNSSDPLRAIGLAIRHDRETRILVANMTPEPRTVTIEGGPRLELEAYAVETSNGSAGA